MLFVSKLTPGQWAEARRLRADGLSYPRIAQRFGIGATTLAKRARKEGWASAGPASAGVSAGKRRAASPATADIRRRLALRLYSVIEFRIRMMELSMQKQLDTLEQSQDGEPPALTRDERDAFAALIASINQVTEMASEPASAADGRRKSAINPELTALSSDIDPDGPAVASKKDQLRTELAEHLAKLLPPA